MPQKNNKDQQKILDELEVIYDNRFKWIQAGKKLRSDFSESLSENPKLGLILKVCIIANVGIWVSFVSLMYHIFGL